VSRWKTIRTEFHRFLSEDRGLRKQTIRVHRLRLDRWVGWLRRKGVLQPRGIRPDHIDAYLSAEGRRFGRSSLQSVVGTLRVFLRFLRLRGVLSRDLSVLVIAPRRYALSHVPRFLDPDQVRRVLGRVDSSTPSGLRDQAMACLMLGLGLRRCEVAALRLGDVDLEAGVLRVPAAKSAQARSLGLTPFEVEPLRAYLKIRPPGGCDDGFFLRMVGRRRLEAISSSQISYRMVRYLRGAGIPHGGCHLFRHTLAQNLADHGAPLGVVQKILGHRWGQTTEIYTKVRLETLREVAENDSLQF